MNNWEILPYLVSTDGKKYRIAYTDHNGCTRYLIEILKDRFIGETRWYWRAQWKAYKLNKFNIRFHKK